MIALTLAEIAAIVGGRIVPSDYPSDLVVDGPAHTDSRLVEPGALFFALPGAETDGHLFAPAAVENGAALVIAERELDLPAPVIVVSNGVEALAALAKAVVANVRESGTLSVIGITGSNGKTTTKNLLRAILTKQGETVAPQGSFNNHVGAPISMLGVTPSTRYLIVEMGASGAGEIARLVSIARPDIGVVLKVGLAHVGEFGGIDAVQQAKSEMVTELPATATAILNADDGRVAAMAASTAASVCWFGLSETADVRAEDIEATAAGTGFTLVADGIRMPVQLRILGEHHVSNALAALAVARELGVDLAEAVVAIEAVPRAERWRMELLRPASGAIVINDAYNASPDSMAAALKTLAQIATPPARSIAVLGEMAELGEYSQEEHDRIGRLAVRLNVKKLIVVGHGARHIHNAAGLEGSWDGESVLVDTPEQAYDLLREDLGAGDIVLVKSSKSANLRFLGDRLGGVAE
ncbi:MAG TPA: UDP-N-acetylmuramoyl-tripeptide--D-alanyl-D-alanine ligase [Galbitalea sp.]